ncbi:hypothetical protein Q0Z83_065910 [Actinoplanes sichuanensis]|uniref:Uncharacterized protein n=1 Tax=Actinoplanes sichuanensis TaxID=512349 RepID=A0ABW4ANZ1_9ACTN|nr:hypothetical protein [Actinoplanes sichuanensis]BEL08400.1 hypothetical protein Q0Z83_065910 [Actinoplanes sichuanensis]
MRSRLWWIPVGLLTAYAVAYFVPGLSAYARYPVYHVKCGGPPIVGTTFASAYNYWLPGDGDYSVNLFSNAYFCTEAEAKAAGFHRAP